MFLLHLLQPGIPVLPVFSCLDQFLVLTTSEAYILAIHLASLVEMLVHCTSVRQSKRLFKNNTHRQGGAHILFMQSTASVHHTFRRTRGFSPSTIPHPWSASAPSFLGHPSSQALLGQFINNMGGSSTDDTKRATRESMTILPFL